jgi:glyoxylase-like metal-dependent hydrolase (beta-lactamase superfamily II)
MLSVRAFTFNAFEENTYVLFDETRQAVIVDPGCYDRPERAQLDGFIAEHNLKVVALVNTHGHIDHVLGNAHVKEKYNVPFFAHPADESTLRSVKVYAPLYGFQHYSEVLPDQKLVEGTQFRFGNQVMNVLFLPGHAPGHIGLHHPGQQVLVAGDVLFQRSIGRTDLPGGDLDTLLHSIRQKLFVLPDETVVYPGHGPTTTIGEEKVHNPFCALAPNT